MSLNTALEAASDAEPRTILWVLAGALLALAVSAAWAEHRRGRRRNLDQVGWVPWNLVQVLAFMAAIAAAALALKG